MKKLALIAAALIVTITILTACSGGDTDVPSGMQKITSDALGCDLIVPKDWSNSSVQSAEPANAIIGAYCSNSDPTNVTVMAWNVDASTTLDTWWETYLDEFDLVFDEFKLTGTESTTLDGIAANKYTYTAKLGENELSYVQCACLHRGMVYIMTFTSKPESVESHAEDYSDIITYFRFH